MRSRHRFLIAPKHVISPKPVARWFAAWRRSRAVSISPVGSWNSRAPPAMRNFVAAVWSFFARCNFANSCRTSVSIFATNHSAIAFEFATIVVLASSSLTLPTSRTNNTASVEIRYNSWKGWIHLLVLSDECFNSWNCASAPATSKLHYQAEEMVRLWARSSE